MPQSATRIFGGVSLHPGDLLPGTAATSPTSFLIGISYDASLGEPLLVGLVPQAHLNDPALFSAHARYAVWVSEDAGIQGNTVGKFTADWPQGTSECWVPFLVHSQPTGLKPLWTPGLIDTGFVDLATACKSWLERREQSILMSHVTAYRDAMVQAVRRAEEKAASLDDDGDHALKRQGCLALPTAAPGASAQRPADAAKDEVHLWLASCQYPTGLLDSTPDDWQLPGAQASPSELSLCKMAHLCEQGQAPDFLLLVGDQVYVDATAGMFDPGLTDDRYRAPYRQWQSPLARRAFGASSASARFPVHTLPDDHEICDNWGPVSRQAPGLDDEGIHRRAFVTNQELLARGLRGYRTFASPISATAEGPPTLYRTVGSWNHPELVFMADTRTERQRRNHLNVDSARIMGHQQWEELQDWLSAGAQPGAGPRFLACPSLVLPRTKAGLGSTPASALHADGWDGYPCSLNALLASVFEHNLGNLILLSGDMHLASLSRIRLRKPGSDRTVVLYGIHAPALYAPYPFANAKPGDFQLGQHTFATGEHCYTCDVDTWFPSPSHGFVSIRAALGTSAATPGKTDVIFRFPDARGPLTKQPDWLSACTSLSVDIDTAAPAS